MQQNNLILCLSEHKFYLFIETNAGTVAHCTVHLCYYSGSGNNKFCAYPIYLLCDFTLLCAKTYSIIKQINDWNKCTTPNTSDINIFNNGSVWFISSTQIGQWQLSDTREVNSWVIRRSPNYEKQPTCRSLRTQQLSYL